MPPAGLKRMVAPAPMVSQSVFGAGSVPLICTSEQRALAAVAGSGATSSTSPTVKPYGAAVDVGITTSPAVIAPAVFTEPTAASEVPVDSEMRSGLAPLDWISTAASGVLATPPTVSVSSA